MREFTGSEFTQVDRCSAPASVQAAAAFHSAARPPADLRHLRFPPLIWEIRTAWYFCNGPGLAPVLFPLRQL